MQGRGQGQDRATACSAKSSVLSSGNEVDLIGDRFSSPGRLPGKNLQPDTYYFWYCLGSTTRQLDQVSFNFHTGLVVNGRQENLYTIIVFHRSIKDAVKAFQ